MLSFRTIFGAALGAAIVASASPALAQSDRERRGRVADEIADGIRDAAEAIITVRDAYDESANGIRFDRHERYAIDRCRPSVERYGRMRVEDVRRYGRRSLRVYGTVDSDSRFGERRYRGRYAMRSFTCTVRDDGRVKVKTKRGRY